MSRRFGRQAQRAVGSPNTLASHLTSQRLPLDLAVSIAVEVIDVVAAAHQQGRTFGHLTAADFVLKPDGAIGITAAPSAAHSTDTSDDTSAVGGVLYQVFTGLTPSQARAQLAVSPLHEVPLASRLNPAVDESVEEMLSRMLDRDPKSRPHSLRVVEAWLVDVCDALELEPSRAAILGWVSAAQTPAVARQPQPSVTRHQRTFVAVPANSASVECGDDDEASGGAATKAPSFSLHFDVWTIAICAFCLLAFVVAMRR